MAVETVTLQGPWKKADAELMRNPIPPMVGVLLDAGVTYVKLGVTGRPTTESPTDPLILTLIDPVGDYEGALTIAALRAKSASYEAAEAAANAAEAAEKAKVETGAGPDLPKIEAVFAQIDALTDLDDVKGLLKKLVAHLRKRGAI